MILIADIHIKLGQKSVPQDWQTNRILELGYQINWAAREHDTLVIAGDLLDSAKPTVDEIGLMYDFLSMLNHPRILLITGNHELGAKKKDCYISLTRMLKSRGVIVLREFTTIDGIDYIPYNILNDSWPCTNSKFAITHVRGTVPPHVEPEIDLQKFTRYDKVFAGDLHSYKLCQENIIYPGSPITTTFHRGVVTGSNGYLVIDDETKEHKWVELFLPQLLRCTVNSADLMVKTEFHHTIYELEGDMDTLAKVRNTDLLDKKITKNISNEASLKFKGDTLISELSDYISEILEEDPKPYIKTFKGIVNDID